jgi:hypothetical protein
VVDVNKTEEVIMKKIALVAIMVLTLVVVAATAQEEPTELITLEQALMLVITPAGLAAFLSIVVEKVPAFQYLSPVQKQWLILGLMFGLPLVATLLLTYARPWLAVIEPIWQALLVAGIVYVGGQFTHLTTKTVARYRELKASLIGASKRR